MTYQSKRLGAIICVVALIATAIRVGTSIPLIVDSSSAKNPIKEYGRTYIYFPNGTTVYTEYEAEDREVGRNDVGIIYETIPESIKIIKKEVTYEAKSKSDPILMTYGYKFYSGVSANSWIYKTISFGVTYSAVPSVTLGPTLAKAENGHIEDEKNRDYGEGVTTTGFSYCTWTTGSGTAATHWMAIGPT